MFNFKAFFSAVFLGIPWLFAGKPKRMATTMIAMVGFSTALVMLGMNAAVVAQQPLGALVYALLPAFFIGFFMAENPPKKPVYRWLLVVFGGGFTWAALMMAAGYAQSVGIIPQWKLDYQKPLSAVLKGDVQGSRKLTLRAARQCKVMADVHNKGRKTLAGEDALLRKEERRILEWNGKLKHMKASLDRNKTSAATRTYNTEVDHFNAAAKAYGKRKKAIEKKLDDTLFLPDAYYSGCRKNKAIHFEIYQKVCAMKDITGPDGGPYRKTNIFCMGYEPHANLLRARAQ